LPLGWTLTDVADMNSDGHPDLVLTRAGSTTQTAIWYLGGPNNITRIGNVFGPTLPAGWTLVAAIDFNDDVHPDYLLTNTSTRQTGVWHLGQNGTFVNAAFGPTLPSGWRLMGAA